MRVLLIEDDSMVRQVLSEALEKEGHHVICGGDGVSAVRLASRESFDAMVLDRLLPRLDGLQVIKKLDAAGNLPPTIIISALNTPFNRAEGLKAGASDYLGKPFSLQEFLARLSVLMRQKAAAAKTILRYSDVHLDLLNMTMRRGDVVVPLKQLEFRLLRFFMRQPESLIGRESLHLGVWGYAFDPSTNIVEVQISRLRKTLNMPGRPKLLHTVRGRGYVLSETKPKLAALKPPEEADASPHMGFVRPSPDTSQTPADAVSQAASARSAPRASDMKAAPRAAGIKAAGQGK